MKNLILPSLLSVLVGITTLGCASLTTEVKPEITLNEKNEVTLIVSPPRYNMCIINSQCSSLGAIWDPTTPDEVTLLIEYKTGALAKKGTLIIDGYPVDLIGSEYDTVVDSYAGSQVGMLSGTKSTTNAYKMPIGIFKKILSAKETSLAVELVTASSKKFYTDRISTEKKKGGGYKAIESLITAINDKV